MSFAASCGHTRRVPVETLRFNPVALGIGGFGILATVTGSLFNQYQISTRLGAGGMEEVFRARDTRLTRDVALRVLPKTFAADAERLRRFQEEAQTLITTAPEDARPGAGGAGWLGDRIIYATGGLGLLAAPIQGGRSVEILTVATWEQFFSIMETKDLAVP